MAVDDTHGHRVICLTYLDENGVVGSVVHWNLQIHTSQFPLNGSKRFERTESGPILVPEPTDATVSLSNRLIPG